MRLTTAKVQWVKNRIQKYCDSMEAEYPSFLFVTKSEWTEWAAYRKDLEGFKRYRNASRYLGICDYKRKVIAIFVKSFSSLDRMDETIRHELVHYVRRYNHHSESFCECMDQLKKGTLKAKNFNKKAGAK